MQCGSIENLIFDGESIRGIERIREIKGLGELLKFGMVPAIFLTILGVGRGGVLQMAWNLSQSDLMGFKNAMLSINPIVKASIEKEAGLQALSHMNKHKQYQFWVAIQEGCR